MTKVLSLRVPDDLAAWVESYADQRGVTRQALIEEGLRSFMEDCSSGVPEIRARVRAQSYSAQREKQGVGECPKSKVGHVWKMVDGVRACEFCGLPGKAFLADFGRARAEMFSGFKPPMTSGTANVPGGGAK